MDINATLLGQMITFGLFVWFTMRFVWPPVQTALEKRQETIAAGLAAAERGQHDLTLAQNKAKDTLRNARVEAERILDQSRQEAEALMGEAREAAKRDADRLLERASEEIKQLEGQLRKNLRADIADLVVMGAERILDAQVDPEQHRALLNQVAEEL